MKSTSQSPILRSFSNLPCSILQLPSRPSSSQDFVPRRAHHGWTYRPIFKHHQVILWMVAKSCTQRMVETLISIVGLYVFFLTTYQLVQDEPQPSTIYQVSWCLSRDSKAPLRLVQQHLVGRTNQHRDTSTLAGVAAQPIYDRHIRHIWINDMWQYQWGLSQNCWIHTQNGSIHGNSHTSGTWVFKDSLTTGFSA